MRLRSSREKVANGTGVAPVFQVRAQPALPHPPDLAPGGDGTGPLTSDRIPSSSRWQLSISLQPASVCISRQTCAFSLLFLSRDGFLTGARPLTEKKPYQPSEQQLFTQQPAGH